MIYLTTDAEYDQALPAGDNMLIYGLPEEFGAQVAANEFVGVTQNSKIIPVSAKANGSLYSEVCRYARLQPITMLFPGVSEI